VRKVKRWRFYCDFCNRAAGRVGTMLKHEKGCSMNPDRHCGICELNGSEQKAIAALTAVVEEHGNSCVKPLREITDNCPVCILAALRQFNAGIEHSDDPIFIVDFDFNVEMQEFWSEHNSGRDFPF